MGKNLPVVIHLQELAADIHNDVSDLLRKALLISTKLKLEDFRVWAMNELNGYKNVSDIPEYRRIFGELRVNNPFHGLIPFHIQEPEIANAARRINVTESVDSLAHLISSKNEKGTIVFTFPSEIEAMLMNMQDSFAPLQPVRVVGVNQIAAILEKIRTRLLEWVLLLESEGIIGEGLSFSDEEKKKAMANPGINIQNFQGILGDVNHGSVTQTMSMTINPGNFDSLKIFLKNQGIEDKDLLELENAVIVDPKPSERGKYGVKVSKWIGKMVGKAADGSWNVTVGAAGNLLAATISKFYGL